MTPREKILLVDQSESGDSTKCDGKVCSYLREHFDVVEVEGALAALSLLSQEEFSGIYILPQNLDEAAEVGRLLQQERILQNMPEGVVVLNSENRIIWHNDRMLEWTSREKILGENFYAVFSSPEILGPDFCPFHTAFSTGEASSSTLRVGENRFYQINALPVPDAEQPAAHLIVGVHDVSREMLQQQKLAAIHKAGIELSDLKPDELLHMTIAERIELLKSNILHYTQDLLCFDVIEIRLLDQKTGRLEPLLAFGMGPEAERRELYARAQDNGVTGFVAATGKSYLCEDTTEDPLYLAGAKDAKSSLTVPLILHDEVIGTFNVESPKVRAFSESDLQFLEIFSRDVAVALNTLELLVAEKASAAAESVEAIHTAVALPVDDILNDAVNVMERYIGHAPEVTERLERILRNARDIKQLIQKVGQRMTPSEAVPPSLQPDHRPLLFRRRLLVADADESVRTAAHALLERYQCVVETAHDGEEAVCMVRNAIALGGYDCVIADIRLPDMTGYDLFLKLGERGDPPPLILMTGFGYDPGHSIVKARRAGLTEVLFKPFRLDQLLETVERALTATGAAPQS